MVPSYRLPACVRLSVPASLVCETTVGIDCTTLPPHVSATIETAVGYEPATCSFVGSFPGMLVCVALAPVHATAIVRHKAIRIMGRWVGELNNGTSLRHDNRGGRRARKCTQCQSRVRVASGSRAQANSTFATGPSSNPVGSLQDRRPRPVHIATIPQLTEHRVRARFLLIALPALIVAQTAAVVGATPNSTLRRATPVPVVANKLAQLKWLAGCWERRTPQLVTLEMWMQPEGELMLGASRTVVGGVTREFEQLRLEARGDTLVYTALPSGQRETAFRSRQMSDTGFMVENLAHDFPQRIIYHRRGADSVIARIEGPGPNGIRGINYPMRRIGCGS